MSISPDRLESLLKQLARPIDRQLNPDPAGERRIGFLLCAFEFGGPGTGLAFISNAEPDTLEGAIRELLRRFKGTGELVTLPEEGAG